jgi:hypothetical protein
MGSITHAEEKLPTIFSRSDSGDSGVLIGD